VFLKRGPVFNSLFLKILFFLTFSLDRNNIGVPLGLGRDPIPSQSSKELDNCNIATPKAPSLIIRINSI
jgi:hypothetical protein